jgi:hypothetical protein
MNNPKDPGLFISICLIIGHFFGSSAKALRAVKKGYQAGAKD